MLGQPFPGPLRFWRVTVAASMRAALSVFELPVGKETATEGAVRGLVSHHMEGLEQRAHLLIALPALTFAVSAAM